MKSLTEDGYSFDNLLNDIFHPNPQINKNASLLMRKYWPVECMNILLLKLEEEYVNLRRKSVLALGELGQCVLSPILEIYINSSSHIIKTSCLKVIIKIIVNNEFKQIPAEVFSIVDLALNEDYPEIILTVISLLKQMGKDGLDRLMTACKDKNILKAKASVTALTEVNEDVVKDFLLKISNDESLDPMIKEDLLNYL